MTDHDPTPPPDDTREYVATVRRRRTWWAVGTGVVVVALTAFLAVGLMNQNVSRELDEAIARGERPLAPAFTLPVLAAAGPVKGPEGAPFSLSELRGKVVVLNIWASWCGPCRDEAPYLQAMSDRFASKGVVVLGLDVQDLSSDAKKFLRDNGLTYPSVRDPNDDVMNAYASRAVPETFVIDRDGRIALTFRGILSQDTAQQLDQAVLEIAAEKPGEAK